MEMAMKQKDKTMIPRRDVLRVLATGASAAAITSTSLTSPAAADTENTETKRKARYKETEHVKAYYRVNRYPS
jgi:hypothetical protein